MEAASTKGTYAGTYFDKDTIECVRKYLDENNIPNPVNVVKLHTTLLYSRKHLPNYEAAGKYDKPMIGKPIALAVWETRGYEDREPANCLVLMYDCPELVARHKELMKEHEATFDYAEYIPHITLSYNIGTIDVDALTDVKKAIPLITIVEEYNEELNLCWAHTAHE